MWQVKQLRLAIAKILGYWVVSSTFYIVQILVNSHIDLLSSILALKATELVSELVNQSIWLPMQEREWNYTHTP